MPIQRPIGLTFNVTFPMAGDQHLRVARAEPLHQHLTAPFNGTIPLATTYLNPQTFQIISSGIDGLYGVGGQYTPNVTGEALPLDPNSNFPSGIYLPYVNTTDNTIRIRERDNITNFHNGKLE